MHSRSDAGSAAVEKTRRRVGFEGLERCEQLVKAARNDDAWRMVNAEGAEWPASTTTTTTATRRTLPILCTLDCCGKQDAVCASGLSGACQSIIQPAWRGVWGVAI